MAKVLFILKIRQVSNVPGAWNYTDDNGTKLDSGLFVSAKQIVKMLEIAGVEVHLQQVVDNNEIDKWVHFHKPTHVIIEALWVVPEKFEVLKKLHPSVKWIVRNHSKVDFLSHEGVVAGWPLEYAKYGVYTASNTIEASEDIQELLHIIGDNTEYSIYLPNYFNIDRHYEKLLPILHRYRQSEELPVTKSGPLTLKQDGILSIGCFGAIRPLKNHMPQAISAIMAAHYLGIPLKFHINSNRIEGQAGGILKSLRALFSKVPNAELIELPWVSHEEFTEYLEINIDMLLQVSLTETFNIICADAINAGIPVVASDQVSWLTDLPYTVSKYNSTEHVTNAILDTYSSCADNHLVVNQLLNLDKYCKEAKSVWLNLLSS